MKRKLGLLAVIAVVVGSICLAGCQSAPSGTAIQPGSAEDPFKGTSWEARGITVLEFGSDGTVDPGDKYRAYTVTKTDAAYVASVNMGMFNRLSLSIENADSDTGIFTANGREFQASLIK